MCERYSLGGLQVGFGFRCGAPGSVPSEFFVVGVFPPQHTRAVYICMSHVMFTRVPAPICDGSAYSAINHLDKPSL